MNLYLPARFDIIKSNFVIEFGGKPMKYRQWNLRPAHPAARAAMEAAGVPPLPAAVLCARGLDTVEKARDFLASDVGLLNDPLFLRDMDAAVARIRAAIDGGEHIAVYGDYDVDGITSTCLLTDYLRSLGAAVTPYIPDRMEEGYGLGAAAVESLHAQGVKLIITVDCGITAVEEADLAASLGVDLIITDHHECKSSLPAAVAVVNPHRPDCHYPFKCLAGVGVALKLALAIAGPAAQSALLRKYADLAAVGTVADVMSVVGENRTIVRMGLSALAHTERPGLKALLREAGLDEKPLTSVSIGYTLAPRINASGRMGCASLAAELLLTADSVRGAELAQELCALNRERQAIELGIFEECVDLADALPPEERPALVLASEGWHQGVVGIVASRLTEKYSCPAFMICLQDGHGKGSCRSFGGFNLFAALEACSDLLEGFGGHELAAGFTIQESNIPAFRARMNRYVRSASGGVLPVSSLAIDAPITSPGEMTLQQAQLLEYLEPYGAGNPRPVFALLGATVDAVQSVGQGKHLKLRLSKGVSRFDAIFFSVTAEECGISAGSRVDVAFHLQANTFRGNTTLQLQLIDIRPSLTPSRHEAEALALLDRLVEGDPVTPQEATRLGASRDQFGAFYLALERRLRQGCCGPQAELPFLRQLAADGGGCESFLRAALALAVFSERGLLSLTRENGTLLVKLRQTRQKVDLFASPYLSRLPGAANRNRGETP